VAAIVTRADGEGVGDTWADWATDVEQAVSASTAVTAIGQGFSRMIAGFYVGLAAESTGRGLTFGRAPVEYGGD